MARLCVGCGMPLPSDASSLESKHQMPTECIRLLRAALGAMTNKYIDEANNANKLYAERNALLERIAELEKTL